MTVSPRWRLPAPEPAVRRGSPPVPGAARLNANESPFPPPDQVVAAIAEAALSCNRYSFGTEGALLERLSGWLGVDTDQLVLGNGSGELIDRVVDALGAPGAQAVYPHPSFPRFSAAVRASGASGVAVPLRPDGSNDLAAMAAAVTSRTTLVIVCNPNNPTGTHIRSAEVGDFLERLPPHPLVLLDEAYVEFSAEHMAGEGSGLDVYQRHPHTLVTRTFSKYFGLAGLRVGYGITSDPELAAQIRIRQGMSSLSRVALAGAVASLGARDIAEERLRTVTKQRDRLVGACQDLGLEPLPSSTNFVLCRQPCPGAAEELGARGLWVRTGESVLYPGMIRMTVGSPADTSRLIDALAELADSARPAEYRHAG